MTTKRNTVFFSYNRNIIKEKIKLFGTLRKYLVGFTLKNTMPFSSFPSFIHINKKNTENTYLKQISLEVIVVV